MILGPKRGGKKWRRRCSRDELYQDIKTISEKIMLKRQNLLYSNQNGHGQNEQKSLEDNGEDEINNGNQVGCCCGVEG